MICTNGFGLKTTPEMVSRVQIVVLLRVLS